MPVKRVRTDSATLNGLLTCGKLTRAEQSAFQEMFDNLAQGMVIQLSPKQRIWADSVYEKYKVGEMVADRNRQARVKVKATKQSALDTMPRPLKPPGR